MANNAIIDSESMQMRVYESSVKRTCWWQLGLGVRFNLAFTSIGKIRFLLQQQEKQ